MSQTFQYLGAGAISAFLFLSTIFLSAQGRTSEAPSAMGTAFSVIFSVAGGIIVVSVALAVPATIIICLTRLRLWAREVHAIDGMFPVLYESVKGQTTYLDVNRQPGSFTAVGKSGLSQAEQPYTAMAALAVQAAAAGAAWTTRRPPNAVHECNEPNTLTAASVDLPTSISLSKLSVPSGQIVLGVGADGVCSAALADLVHVGVGGSSGWGKSEFLRSIVYQVARNGLADLALVDLERSTFDAPGVIDSRDCATRLLDGLVAEINERRTRQLPLLVVVDEATALLADSRIEGLVKELALRARKYQVFLVLGGQDWKAVSLDTAIRNQLSTRVQFQANDAAQSRVLLGSHAAAGITVRGRAVARLPGRGLQHIQSPLVDRAEFERILAGVTLYQPGRPAPAPNGQELDDAATRISELHSAGHSVSSIAREVYGSSGGAAFYRVKDIIASATTTTPETACGSEER